MNASGIGTILLSGWLLSALVLAPAPAWAAGPSKCNGAPNGMLDGQEECETGPCCTSRCTLEPVGTVCRPSASAVCDPQPESCNQTEPVAHAACAPNVTAPDGTDCNDGLFCTADDECQDGQCTGASLACDDGNPCTVDTCNEKRDDCAHADAEEGASCNDGLFCNGPDVCTGGVCAPDGSPVDCLDENPCTNDSCNEATDQCDHTPNAAPCNDGLFCTTNDICSGGTCGGTANACSDNNDCTTDSCDEDANVCGHSERTGECDDGQFCTVGDTCSSGSCIGSQRDCGDDNFCTSDFCDEEDECGHVNNVLACDDGLFCTVGDACSGGTCTGAARGCSDNNDCTDDSCDEAGDQCVSANNTAACNDGLFCTVGDTCSGGQCAGTARVCNDGNDCTDDSCDEAGDACATANNTNACDDGLFCTVGDACSGGQCGGTPRSCADNNDCTDDSCDESGDACVQQDNDDPCDDGLFCTASDACSGGSCTGTVRDCGDSNGCTDDSCDEDADECVNADNDDACDDGLFCTVGDACAGGECTGTARNCSDNNDCTSDSCIEGNDSCNSTPNNDVCNDGDPCTENDECQQGECTGEEIEGCGTTTTTMPPTTTTLPPTTTTMPPTTTTLPPTTTTTLECPTCGDVNGDCELKASDALGVLQAAVGSASCPLSVCDFSGDGKISATDALATLRAAVGLPSDPQCPGA